MDKLKEYFTTKAVSNSMLGALYNPKWVKFKMENPDSEDDDKKFFRIGAGLDCLLTSPQRWDQDFQVIDAVRPFGLMGKFIDNLPKDINILSDESEYREAWDKSGYKMKLSKIIEKFWENEEFVNYHKLIRNISDNTTILSKDEYETIVKTRDCIIDNPYTHKYFFHTSPKHQLYHQVPIYFEHQNTKCKALLDGILVDHAAKTIEPFDLKTTGKSVYEFPASYMQFGYYRQCAFYELALQKEDSPVYGLLNLGYELLDFVFIVVETKLTSTNPSIIYVTSKKDREAGLNGGVIGRKKYKGINQLLDEYNYYVETGDWNMPKDLVDSKGKIYLDVFNAEEQIFSIADVES